MVIAFVTEVPRRMMAKGVRRGHVSTERWHDLTSKQLHRASHQIVRHAGE
ncbi:MAG: hypothetical protein H6Q33_1356, partial [Deltaproteobacteria bacterium]|nr:hypothetical protein [Deltaproteobacteria bacterium]